MPRTLGKPPFGSPQQLPRRHRFEQHVSATERGTARGERGLVVASERHGDARSAIDALQLLENRQTVAVRQR